MPTLVPSDIGRVWERNGGSAAHVIDAVSVALAESGGRTDAISPAADYGLWQINEANFANLGINRVTAMDPNVSAQCAIRMSGNGTNWAAWCTAWAQPDGNCGHGLLPHPQVGSPANEQLDRAQSIGGENVGTIDLSTVTFSDDGVTGGWSYFQDTVGAYSRTKYNHLVQVVREIRKL